jgi:hypothetical protein
MVPEIIIEPCVMMHQLSSNSAKDNSKIMCVVCKNMNIHQILHQLVKGYKTTMPLLPGYILLVFLLFPLSLPKANPTSKAIFT